MTTTRSHNKTTTLYSHHPPKEEKVYEVEHEVGVGVLHLGSHIHGANPVDSGTRVNLIIWCKAEQQASS